MAIQNTSLSATTSSIITSTGTTAIVTIHLCNYTSNSVTANIFLVPSGGSANLSTLVYSNVSISAYNTLVIDREKFILATGDAIFANVSTGSSVTATVSSIGV